MRFGQRTGNRGQALLMITMGLVAMCGVMGLAVDLGWAYFVKKSAQAAADSAALAAVAQAYATVGGATTFSCGVGIVCQAPTPCGQPNGNMTNGCQYALQNGFSHLGNNGHQEVTLQANTTSPPPTAPGVFVDYWVTARVSENVPQLFSAVMGFMNLTITARATAAVVDSPTQGSIYLLNRQNDSNPGLPKGQDLSIQGSSSITAAQGVYMASTGDCLGSDPCAAHANGTANVISSFIGIRGAGDADRPGNFTPGITNGLADGSTFQDPMKGKGQPPAPAAASVPDHPVPDGTITGSNNCNSPTVLPPGSYYATTTNKKGVTVASGLPISITGCVTFASGGSWGDYQFFGGTNFSSPGTTVTFGPGRYVMAGALSSGSVFSQSNGVTLQDSTPLVNGTSQPNTDAGEIFIFTDTNYPGMYVPAAVQGIASSLTYGTVDIQMGNNAMSLVNLHGINATSAALPAGLKTFAPTAFWQDQGNTNIGYLPDGSIDTTSCGAGHSLDNPCPSTDPQTKNPVFNMQAHPDLHLYGVMYQPRGGLLNIQGHGMLTSTMMIITGGIQMGGGGAIIQTLSNNALTRKIVALVE